MKWYPLAVFSLLAFFAVTGAGAPGKREVFVEFVRLHSSDELFVPTISSSTREAIAAYQTRTRLSNGLRYGDSVRGYSLAGKSAAEVRADMKRLNCAFKEDVLRTPEDNRPKLYSGHTLAIWIFTCPDGGVVRVKPQGDPSNPYRPHVHGNKSLRFPFDAKFENFSDEVAKVDEEGNVIPKSRAELAPQDLVDGWSEDAHADLRE